MMRYELCIIIIIIIIMNNDCKRFIAHAIGLWKYTTGALIVVLVSRMYIVCLRLDC